MRLLMISTSPLAVGLFAAALLGGAAAQAEGSARPSPQHAAETTPRAIENAATEGQLSRDEAILLKALSLYAPERVPGAYRGVSPDKCGTPTARAIERALPDLPRDLAEVIRGLRARPVCMTFYDTTHFRIHYDTSGNDMIHGWPSTAYRDSLAAALEKSWAEEIGGMGFRQPPSDGSDPDGGGGNALYDVYVQGLTAYFGYCQGMYTVPSTPRTDCTSYIVVENDYAGFGYVDPTEPLKVTVAHEFNHACQFSHDYLEGDWYMECTSTWIEDVLYDDINDYRGYLFYFLNYPYNSLEWNDGTGLRIYGSCIWNYFLVEHVGPTVVREVWYACETATEWNALDSVLSTTYGTSLAEAFATFATWNWFTGARDDGNHYEEGLYWPLVAAERTYGAYPVVNGGPLMQHRPDHLAWNFIHFTNPAGSDDILDLVYDGPDLATTPNSVSLNTRSWTGVKAEYGKVPLDANGNGSATVTGWDDLSQVCLVAVNASTSSDNMPYAVNVDLSTPVEGTLTATAATPDAVVLRWTLASPQDVVSLDILRATSSDGPFEAVNPEPLAPLSPGSFVDTDIRPGDELSYELMAALADGRVESLSAAPVFARVPGSLGLSLSPPRPNPFSGSAKFELTVPGAGSMVRLAVYDLGGRHVATVLHEALGRGRHVASWDGRDETGREAAAGVYFCSLEVPGAVVTQRAVVLR